MRRIMFLFLLLLIFGCIGQEEHQVEDEGEKIIYNCSEPNENYDQGNVVCNDDCKILGENFWCNSECKCVEKEIPEEPGIESVCGNGNLDKSEQCETDKDCFAWEYCSEDCQCIEKEVCGNGKLTESEECETDLGCSENEICRDCECIGVGVGKIKQPDPVCGNGLMEDDELCEFQPQCGGDGVCIDCKCWDYFQVKEECYYNGLGVLVNKTDECLLYR